MASSPLPLYPPYSATEFDMLTSFLDYYRAVMARKIEGLDADGLRRSPVDSGTSLGGLLKHLGYVERQWFGESLGGLELDFPWKSDPDADFHLDTGETAESLIAFYQAECERSRSIVEDNPDLNRVVRASHDRQVSLRWILVHMIEETARHAGHADILREMHDGEVGD